MPHDPRLLGHWVMRDPGSSHDSFAVAHSARCVLHGHIISRGGQHFFPPPLLLPDDFFDVDLGVDFFAAIAAPNS